MSSHSTNCFRIFRRCLDVLPIMMLFCTVCFSQPVEAEGLQLLKPEPYKPGWETWLDEVPISGDIRVGVMAGPQKNAVNRKIFTVFLPASTLPRLCVTISSQDGRYEAKLEYNVRGIKPGPVNLSFPTNHEKELFFHYKADELAILAQLNRQCDAHSGIFVVSSWNDKVSTDTVSIYVNSREPTYIIASENGHVVHETRCDDMQGSKQVAYNLICRIPSSWIAPSMDFTIRKRTMIRGKIKNLDRALPLQFQGVRQ